MTQHSSQDKDRILNTYIISADASIVGTDQRWKKYPNLRTRFAENFWTLRVSQKILAKYHA